MAFLVMGKDELYDREGLKDFLDSKGVNNAETLVEQIAKHGRCIIGGLKILVLR